jgi:hypothetical protein
MVADATFCERATRILSTRRPFLRVVDEFLPTPCATSKLGPDLGAAATVTGQRLLIYNHPAVGCT